MKILQLTMEIVEHERNVEDCSKSAWVLLHLVDAMEFVEEERGSTVVAMPLHVDGVGDLLVASGDGWEGYEVAGGGAGGGESTGMEVY